MDELVNKGIPFDRAKKEAAKVTNTYKYAKSQGYTEVKDVIAKPGKHGINYRVEFAKPE